jgi:short-subunit dehydrogenase
MPDRAAIVTGASRGIGLALAETLAAEGYGVTISARTPDTLEEVAGRLRESGFEVESVAANLADADAIAGIVARHRERFARLDVLVNTRASVSGRPPRSTRPNSSTCSSA